MEGTFAFELEEKGFHRLNGYRHYDNFLKKVMRAGDYDGFDPRLAERNFYWIKGGDAPKFFPKDEAERREVARSKVFSRKASSVLVGKFVDASPDCMRDMDDAAAADLMGEWRSSLLPDLKRNDLDPLLIVCHRDYERPVGICFFVLAGDGSWDE